MKWKRYEQLMPGERWEGKTEGEVESAEAAKLGGLGGLGSGA